MKAAAIVARDMGGRLPGDAAALKKLPGSPTVFIVSQRTSSIAHADCILVLDEGAVVGMGTHEQLLAKGGFYANLYNSQFAA